MIEKSNQNKSRSPTHFPGADFRLIVIVPEVNNFAIDLQCVVGAEVNDDVGVQYHEGNIARCGTCFVLFS